MQATAESLSYQLYSVADRYGITSVSLASELNTDLRSLHGLPDIIPAEALNEAVQLELNYSRKLVQRVSRHNEGLATELGAYADLPTAKVVKEQGVPRNVKSLPKGQSDKPARKVCRAEIFGYSVTAVLRWMGLNNWTFEDAGVACATLGAGGISDTTIRIQLAAGKKGERGEPAPLTKAQAKQLKQATK